MSLADGTFSRAVMVSQEDENLVEIAFVNGEAHTVTLYTRHVDEALWVKSIKVEGVDFASGTIVGEVTMDDPMYYTLNNLMACAFLVEGGKELGDGTGHAEHGKHIGIKTVPYPS